MSEAASYLSAGFLSRLHVVNRYQLVAESSCSIHLLVPLNLSTSNCVEEFPLCRFLAPKSNCPPMRVNNLHVGSPAGASTGYRVQHLVIFSTGLVTREILNQGLGELLSGGA
jgi:hypothetical protein